MQIEAFKILHFLDKIIVIGLTTALSKDVNAESVLILPNILKSVLIHTCTFCLGKQEEQNKQKPYIEERGNL